MHTIWHTADGLLPFFFFLSSYSNIGQIIVKIVYCKPFHSNDFTTFKIGALFSDAFATRVEC